MNHRPTLLRRHMLTLCAVGACLFTVPAVAQNDNMADAMAKYKADIERCNRGDTTQDVATCKREAGAALQEARRHRLIRNGGSYDQNATARCDPLPQGEREDCILQMQATGTETLPDGRRVTTTTQGSIAQGGIIRQTEIVTPGETTYTTTYTTPSTASPSPVPPPAASPTIPAPSLR